MRLNPNPVVHIHSRFQPIAFFILISILVFACNKKDVPQSITPPQSASVHLTMGNPSRAISDPSQPSNYLMVKPQYVLSHHRDRGIPNWVSCHLDKSWIGNAARQGDFHSDQALPSGWYRVQSTDYTCSGFDRGHHTPSTDRTKTVEDNSATFFMINVLSQAPENNQETWANLESYCRTLVNAGNELYIIMGSYGEGGTSSAGMKKTIAGGMITVPARIWKVLVVLPEGSDDATRVSTSTRIIAVETPNSNTVKLSWSTYRTSGDAIEAATGYDILSSI